MADSDKAVEDAKELTDEMKEKLLLNLLGDSVKTKLDQMPGDDASINPGGADGDRSQGASEKNEMTENKEASGLDKQDKAEVNPIVELEEKLKLEEDGLSEEQLEDRNKKSQQLKADANNLYKDGLYGDAVAKYSEALELCPLRETKSRSVLYANKAAALMGESNNKEALPHLDRALELDEHYFKALERRARLNKMLDNLDDSLKDYEKLLEMKPKHCEYTLNVRELKERIHVRNEEMKQKMMDSLKQLGNVFLKPFGLSTDNFNMVPNENGGYSVQMGGQR